MVWDTTTKALPKPKRSSQGSITSAMTTPYTTMAMLLPTSNALITRAGRLCNAAITRAQIAPRLRSSSMYNLLPVTKAISRPEHRAETAMEISMRRRSVGLTNCGAGRR